MKREREEKKTERKRSRSRSQERANKWGKQERASEKEKPCFTLSGALNEDRNSGKLYKGEVLKWCEPVEARVPKDIWKVFVFQDKLTLDTIELYKQSAYLVGRAATIADICISDSSVSKQHAVIQFRLRVLETQKKVVLPYLLDLESSNGTFLNGERVEAARYIELKDKDVVRFGDSPKEFVFLLASTRK